MKLFIMICIMDILILSLNWIMKKLMIGLIGIFY
jgi:hypothetical protein